MSSEFRSIGKTGIMISPVAMGCWPIAGLSSLNVNDKDSLATLEAALDSGVNFFDTAYSYGLNGESERLIARAFAGKNSPVIATKCGLHRDAKGIHINNDPGRMRKEVETSLKRLKREQVELLYLHAPDKSRPIEESAETMALFKKEGKTRSIGVSNFNLKQLETFHKICPISAVQPPFNMIQRGIEADILPWCADRQISVMVYYPLLKGFLAGRLPREHRFAAGDRRADYPMFQGEKWEKNHQLLDGLKEIAKKICKSVGQVSINWTINRKGVTAALCGARQPWQIRDTAGAMGWSLMQEEIAKIEDLIQRAAH